MTRQARITPPVYRLLFAAPLGLVMAASASAAAEEPPIVALTEDPDICDQEALVVLIEDDVVYIEVETPQGVERQILPNNRVLFGFDGGVPLTVLFEISEPSDRSVPNNSLYVSADTSEETTVNVRGGLGEYTLLNYSWVYEFDWRPTDQLETPATPDVIFEPSPNCPPPKLDSELEV